MSATGMSDAKAPSSSQFEKPPPYAPPYYAGPETGYQAHSLPATPMHQAFQPTIPSQPVTAAIPPGYNVVPAPSLHGYGSTVVVGQPIPQTQVILVGGCPACRTGILQDDYTWLGVCLAVFLFPLGILCCLAMRQRRCSYCGAIFE